MSPREEPRYLETPIREDLAKKMVFLSGPRQVGKTTLAKRILGRHQNGYLNWDAAEHRERILKRELPSSPLWVFDEIHKYRPWRGLLKGLYDTRREGPRFLVTGSARLDFYRHGGDWHAPQHRCAPLHDAPLAIVELSASSADSRDRPRPFHQSSMPAASA